MEISKLKVSNSEVYEIKDKKVNDYLISLKPNNIKFFNGVKWRPNKHDNFRRYHKISSSLQLQYLLYYNEHCDRCKYMYISPTINFDDTECIYITAWSNDHQKNIEYHLPKVFKINFRLINEKIPTTYLLDIKHFYKVISNYIFGPNNNSNTYIDDTDIRGKLIHIHYFPTYHSTTFPYTKFKEIPDISSIISYTPIEINIDDNDISYFLKKIENEHSLYKVASPKYNINVYTNNKVYYTVPINKMQESFNQLSYILENTEQNSEITELFSDPRTIFNLYHYNYSYLFYWLLSAFLPIDIKYINISEIKFANNNIKDLFFDSTTYISNILVNSAQSLNKQYVDNSIKKNKLVKSLILFAWLGGNLNNVLWQGNTKSINKNDIEYVILNIKFMYKKYIIIPNYYIKLSYTNGKLKCTYVDKYTKTFIY